MTKVIFRSIAAFALVATLIVSASFAQKQENQKIRTVSIPISIYTKQELKQGQTEEFLQADLLAAKENGEEQTILSIRSVVDAPLSLSVLIQEDLTSQFNLQLKDIRTFILGLPKGSRVMVAYMRGGSLDIRQKFTPDLEKAAASIRIISSSSYSAPRNPYDSLTDALDRFDALPAGRRAVLMLSDGLDLSNDAYGASPSQSTDLQIAINRAQRKNVAVFSFYFPTETTENGNKMLALFGQGSLDKLANETGGRFFAHGTITPLNFDPFFKQLKVLLTRQFLLTYLTANMKKGYYKVEVTSTNPEVKIEHPKGYYYRR